MLHSALYWQAKLALAFLAFVSPFALHAQTVLYSEDFETGGGSITINTTDMSSTSSGTDNPWIINNVFAGGSGTFSCLGFNFPFTVPPAPNQPAGITNSPNSQHLHITPQIAIDDGNPALTCASYIAADGTCIFGGQNTFSRMSADISTMGYDSVEFDHWWACGGSNNYYGELYYSTDGGTSWTAVMNPASGTTQWRNQTTWANTQLSDPAWANQATLRFGFRFVSGSSSSGSELDPGYALDDIEITGFVVGPSCTPTAFSFSDSGCDSYISPSGLTWTSSNTYMDTIQNAAGCDSVITINLTINNTYVAPNSVGVQACNANYTAPSGAVWTMSGNYTDTLPNMHGCDSISKFFLTITSIDTNVTLSGTTLMSDDTSSQATFQWIDCDNNNAAIAGATGATFMPMANGNYAVVITLNGCMDTSVCTQVVGVNTSLIENASPYRLYPNPTTGTFTLDFGTSTEQANIEIFNSLGQLVEQKSYSSVQQVALELEGPSGMYWVKIQTNSQTWSSLKILKQ